MKSRGLRAIFLWATFFLVVLAVALVLTIGDVDPETTMPRVPDTRPPR